MHPRDKYPQLDVYFGAYLHQDWADEFANPGDAFEELLHQLSGTELPQLVNELDQVVSLRDREMLETLDLLSTYFDPRAGYGWDEREWLTSLRDRARAELERRQVGSSAAGNA